MKLAYWSPLSPRGTGIADYSEELLPYLADKGADIHLFVDDYEPDNRAIVEQFPWHPAREYEQVAEREAFDLNLYQIGNSSYHRYALNAALRFPGVVVLHDLVLQHLFLGLSVERGDSALYVSEMKRAYGERGAALGRQVAAALGSELLTSKFPLCERMIERSYGVLVLTRFMQRWLERRFGAIPVGKFIGRAPHHYAPAPPLFDPASRRVVDTKAEARRALGLPGEAFVVASFGLATRAKRIDRALEGFRRFLATSGPATDARFLVVGEVQEGYELDPALVAELGDRLVLAGRQPMDRFYLYMLACDVVVNLRFPSTGELSGTLIRTLGMGKPVLVSNTGPFAEFPEHTVARIDLGLPEAEAIAGTLRLFHERPDLRAAMGRFAREHVESFYKLEDEADAYMAFLTKVVAARHEGTLAPPPPYDQADLAASVMTSISDMPLGTTFGLETVRETLRDVT
ncbi:MAG: glycosyltransferase family 4 protein [Acidobacteriota bacterium]|nr:MAG: glycosyltransferase family 4 protein [Acidobacteriota bacterium]